MIYYSDYAIIISIPSERSQGDTEGNVLFEQHGGSILDVRQPLHAFRLTVAGRECPLRDIRPGNTVSGIMAAEGTLLRITFTVDKNRVATLQQVHVEDYNDILNGKPAVLTCGAIIIPAKYARFDLPPDEGLEVPEVVRSLLEKRYETKLPF